MVYLLHFDKPFHHANHYIGFTDEKLEQRLERHKSGDGARILRAITKAGIEFEVARTWEDGDRNFERWLKNQKKASRFCPICQARAKKNRGETANESH
ncbi:endonuclease [bacterium]|nr:MAG: endonuclease [bacterium]